MNTKTRIEDALGMLTVGVPMDPQESQSQPSEIPEDTMELTIEVRTYESPRWYSTTVTRPELSKIMNSHYSGELPGFLIDEICICTMEGELCNMRYIYSFSRREWRFE